MSSSINILICLVWASRPTFSNWIGRARKIRCFWIIFSGRASIPSLTSRKYSRKIGSFWAKIYSKTEVSTRTSSNSQSSSSTHRSSTRNTSKIYTTSSKAQFSTSGNQMEATGATGIYRVYTVRQVLWPRQSTIANPTSHDIYLYLYPSTYIIRGASSTISRRGRS